MIVDPRTALFRRLIFSNGKNPETATGYRGWWKEPSVSFEQLAKNRKRRQMQKASRKRNRRR